MSGNDEFLPEMWIGLTGIVRTPVAPEGMVEVRGELWKAVSDEPLAKDDPAEVTGLDGLVLHVRKGSGENG